MQTLVALGMAVGALVGVNSAHAVINTVILQGDPSPNGGAAYRRPREFDVADLAAERAGFICPTSGGDKCIYLVDPNGAPGTGTVVACQKDQSPDNRLYSKFRSLSVNALGIPLFAARTTVGFDGVYRGIVQTVVVLTNDPLGPQFLDNMSNTVLTDVGDAVFLTELTGGAPGDTAILRCSGGDGNCSPNTVPPGTGTLTTLVRLGDSVPDRAGREFCSLIGLDASSFGVTFTATTALDCTDAMEVPLTGIFRRPFAGAVATVALVGEASGVGPTTWVNFRGIPTIANGGKIGFEADLAGTPSTALFVCDPATCPAASPTEAIGIGELDGSGNALRTFSAPSISDAGDLVFNTRLTGGPAGSTNGVFIWRSATDTVVPVATRFDAVPGMPGAIFSNLLVGPPRFSPAGKVLFKARIKRPTPPRTRFGLFIDE
jgi:hypothetical protein